MFVPAALTLLLLATTRDVSIPAGDLELRGTYFPAGKQAPAVLLLHQCSGADRRDYSELGTAFQTAGLSALTLDFRAFGDSRNDRYRDFGSRMEEIEALWPGDVERAYQWLIANPEVDPARLAVVGSSCGNAQAVYLARNHPEIRALTVLSGSFDASAEKASAAVTDRPLFLIYSEEDGYGTPESMSKLFRRATHPLSKEKTYEGGIHGVSLLRHDEGLTSEIVRWTVEQLAPSVNDHRGQWGSEGYGYYLEIKEGKLEAYEVTSMSCLPSFTAATSDGVEFKVADEPATFSVRPGGSPDVMKIHMNGTASDIVMRRLSSRPRVCDERLPDTPLTNFDVFARTWAEQYGFFDLKKADWPAIVAAHRGRVNDRTEPKELFQILKEMIEPFEDAHTSIDAESIGESWNGSRKNAHWLEREERPRAFEIVEHRYLRSPVQSFCNGNVQYGRLDGGVAYLRLKSFYGYGPEAGYESGLDALEAALDAIFAEAPSWRGLVIDVRINGGGADPYGLAIASRLATKEYLAYAKEARSDPEDATRWTEPQPSWVRPTARASFHGPVVELIGIHSVSAAETFTQALIGREPSVTRVGENTQGVFSDVLGRRLPNGWSFGLPNERFVTDGKSYDGPGIPPDVEVPVFPRADLEAGKDGALDKALEILGMRTP